GDSEEIFYVLGGSGQTLLDDKAYEIRAGDCIVYKNFHEAHTIRAGADGLDVIAFGPREYLGSGELPRGRTMWSITGFVEVQKGHPWDREPNLEWPEPEAARPATVVNVQDVEPQVRGGRRHSRADTTGARRRARGAVRSQGLSRRASAGHGCRACVSRGRVRYEPHRVGRARAERHLLVPALAEDVLEGSRRGRTDRAARLLGRRRVGIGVRRRRIRPGALPGSDIHPNWMRGVCRYSARLRTEHHQSE